MSGVRVEENVIVFIIFFQKRIKATNTDSKTSQTIKNEEYKIQTYVHCGANVDQKMHRP